ncbi:hypothetical protein [Microcystis aeruginosa]|nr:hypothetical protein [Microcystis aeruginosa]
MSASSAYAADSDRDGLPDEWELAGRYGSIDWSGEVMPMAISLRMVLVAVVAALFAPIGVAQGMAGSSSPMS